MAPQSASATPLSPAMPPLDRAAYLTAMRQKMEAVLGQVADAVNNAPDGAVIAGSECEVRDLFADLRHPAYELAIPMRSDAAEAAFPPSEECGDGGEAPQYGPPGVHRAHGQRPPRDPPRPLARGGGRQWHGDRRVPGPGRAVDQRGGAGAGVSAQRRRDELRPHGGEPAGGGAGGGQRRDAAGADRRRRPRGVGGGSGRFAAEPVDGRGRPRRSEGRDQPDADLLRLRRGDGPTGDGRGEGEAAGAGEGEAEAVREDASAAAADDAGRGSVVQGVQVGGVLRRVEGAPVGVRDEVEPRGGRPARSVRPAKSTVRGFLAPSGNGSRAGLGPHSPSSPEALSVAVVPPKVSA